MASTVEPQQVSDMIPSSVGIPSPVVNDTDDDPLWIRLRNEALEAMKEEPELSYLLHSTVLAPDVKSFDEAVAKTVSYRMIGRKCTSGGQSPPTNQEPSSFCPNALHGIILSALQSSETELGHTMSEAIREDALAVCKRDPACETLLEVVLFFKGYAALVAHRAARRKWNQSSKRRSMVALFLQSQASQVFGLDIHPASQIGKGVLLDHGTGIVIGETAMLGDGCTMLHGVTLGGTGKDTGDRHPKVGKNVLIGAGASILGNVVIGDNAKIGAGSIVLRPIPSGATAVGAPAKIIGRAKEQKPGSDMDETLSNVILNKAHVPKKKHHHHHDKNKEGGEKDQEAKKPPLPLNRSENSFVTVSTVSDTLSDSDSDNNTNSDSSSSLFNRSPICPFREIDKDAFSKAPKGTVTHMVLARSWYSGGASCAEIGEVFFDLDTKGKGYVSLKDFEEKSKDLVSKYTKLEADWAVEAVKKFVSQRDQHKSN